MINKLGNKKKKFRSHFMILISIIEFDYRNNIFVTEDQLN